MWTTLGFRVSVDLGIGVGVGGVGFSRLELFSAKILGMGVGLSGLVLGGSATIEG